LTVFMDPAEGRCSWQTRKFDLLVSWRGGGVHAAQGLEQVWVAQPRSVAWKADLKVCFAVVLSSAPASSRATSPCRVTQRDRAMAGTRGLLGQPGAHSGDTGHLGPGPGSRPAADGRQRAATALRHPVSLRCDRLPPRGPRRRCRRRTEGRLDRRTSGRGGPFRPLGRSTKRGWAPVGRARQGPRHQRRLRPVPGCRRTPCGRVSDRRVRRPRPDPAGVPRRGGWARRVLPILMGGLRLTVHCGRLIVTLIWLTRSTGHARRWRLLHFDGRPVRTLGSNGSTPPTQRRSDRTAPSPLRWPRVLLGPARSTADLAVYRSPTHPNHRHL